MLIYIVTRKASNENHFNLTREATRYKGYYFGAILATLCLTIVNLIVPRILSNATGVIGRGVDSEGLSQITKMAVILAVLYVLRVVNDTREFELLYAHITTP